MRIIKNISSDRDYDIGGVLLTFVFAVVVLTIAMMWLDEEMMHKTSMEANYFLTYSIDQDAFVSDDAAIISSMTSHSILADQ